jgi:hypothetical protein
MQTGKMTMQSVLIFFTLAIAGLGGCSSAPAREGPWCLVWSIAGTVLEDCSYWTIQQCARDVVGGNRGQCDQNPRWRGDRRHRGKRKR